jgi:hypothetical protein
MPGRGLQTPQRRLQVAVREPQTPPRVKQPLRRVGVADYNRGVAATWAGVAATWAAVATTVFATKFTSTATRANIKYWWKWTDASAHLHHPANPNSAHRAFSLSKLKFFQFVEWWFENDRNWENWKLAVSCFDFIMFVWLFSMEASLNSKIANLLNFISHCVYDVEHACFLPPLGFLICQQWEKLSSFIPILIPADFICIFTFDQQNDECIGGSAIWGNRKSEAP